MRFELNLATRVTLVRVLLIPVFLVALLGDWPTWLPTPATWRALQPWLAAATFTLLAATDGVDGYLARRHNQITTFGKFIDPLADKLLVTAALVALVDLDTLPAWIAIVIVSRELIVSGLRMVAIAEGKVVAAAPIGKAKTVLQSIAVVFFILKGNGVLGDILGTTLSSAFTGVSWVLMGVALALTIWSMLAYFYHARDVLTGPWTR